MAKLRVLECTVFIPMCRDANLSDGQPHFTEAWEWLEGELYSHFGGLTVAPGLYAGIYQDPDTGDRVPDKSRKYIIALPATRIKDLRRLLGMAKSVFQQKCIYLSVAGQVEFL